MGPTAEDLRRWIIYAVLGEPHLGENYVDWHTETGECGLTIKYPAHEFEIVIRQIK